MLKIRTAPDPTLNTVCIPCEPGDRSLERIAKQMTKLMYGNMGCGIAAPQVGLNKRLIVIDVDWDGEDPATQNPIVLVNPEIIELSGDPVTEKEGCLSCPGISVSVTRQPYAKVSFLDLDGEEWEIEGDGLLGRCLQHEIDHLEGKTLFESSDPELKVALLEAYDRARSMGARPGDTSIVVE